MAAGALEEQSLLRQPQPQPRRQLGSPGSPGGQDGLGSGARGRLHLQCRVQAGARFLLGEREDVAHLVALHPETAAGSLHTHRFPHYLPNITLMGPDEPRPCTPTALCALTGTGRPREAGSCWHRHGAGARAPSPRCSWGTRRRAGTSPSCSAPSAQGHLWEQPALATRTHRSRRGCRDGKITQPHRHGSVPPGPTVMNKSSKMTKRRTRGWKQQYSIFLSSLV